MDTMFTFLFSVTADLSDKIFSFNICFKPHWFRGEYSDRHKDTAAPMIIDTIWSWCYKEGASSPLNIKRGLPRKTACFFGRILCCLPIFS